MAQPISFPFLSEDEFNNLKPTHTAELFAIGYYNGRNIGASRHLNGDYFQIKGSGRNQLAIRRDFKHASGSLGQYSAFREFYWGNVLKKVNSELVVNYFAFGDFLEKDKSFVIREKYLPRLIQLTPYNLSENEKNNLKRELQKENVFSLKDLIKLHIRKFVSAYLLGIINTSYNFENLTLDGRIIDVESLVHRSSKESLIMPIVNFDGLEYNYFQFLKRNMDYSIIPVGKSIYNESDVNLTELVTAVLGEFSIEFKLKNQLLSMFLDTRKMPDGELLKETSSKEFILGELDSPLKKRDIDLEIKHNYNLWSKIKTVSNAEAQNFLEERLSI